MRTIAIVTTVAMLASPAVAETRARYLMGTICEITATDPREIEAAFDEASRVERMISTWRDDSELSRYNRGEDNVSPELDALLRDALRIAHETNGAFNPQIRSLIDAWDTRGKGRIPTDREIAEAMRAKKFDEGAFGKGYALDKMLTKIASPHAVLNFGGQLLVRGSERVTIAHPLHRDQPILEITLTDASVSTSSGSEKTFTVGTRHFSHLIDPATGVALPPRGSVSVVHRSAFVADALSTALYVMGSERGLDWARAHGVAAIFISESGDITKSMKELP
jgi:thiamine biosynthesis lipoprotein